MSFLFLLRVFIFLFVQHAFFYHPVSFPSQQFANLCLKFFPKLSCHPMFSCSLPFFPLLSLSYFLYLFMQGCWFPSTTLWPFPHSCLKIFVYHFFPKFPQYPVFQVHSILPSLLFFSLLSSLISLMISLFYPIHWFTSPQTTRTRTWI
jgi:hypothetical protein